MPIAAMMNQIAIIFLMIVVGVVATRAGVITKEAATKLGNILVKVCLPCSIIASAQIDESMASIKNMTLVIAIASAYYIFAIITTNVLGKGFKLEKERKAVFISNSVFANTSFLGIPICTALFGEIGTFYAVCANLLYNVFMWTYGIVLFSGQKKFDIKVLFKSPATIASVIMILLIVFKVKLPPVILETSAAFGKANLPISMIVISFTIAQTQIKQVLQGALKYCVSFLRLLFFPLVMLLVLSIFKVDATVAMTSIIVAACPCGSLNVILSGQYGCDEKFAAQSVVQSMIFFVVTMPAIMYLTNLILF